MGLENYRGISLAVIMLSPDSAGLRPWRISSWCVRHILGLGQSRGHQQFTRTLSLQAGRHWIWGLCCGAWGQCMCACAHVPQAPLVAGPIPCDGSSAGLGLCSGSFFVPCLVTILTSSLDFMCSLFKGWNLFPLPLPNGCAAASVRWVFYVRLKPPLGPDAWAQRRTRTAPLRPVSSSWLCKRVRWGN